VIAVLGFVTYRNLPTLRRAVAMWGIEPVNTWQPEPARAEPSGYVDRWDVYRKWRNWLRAVIVYGAEHGFSRSTLYDYFRPRYPFASQALIYRTVSLLADTDILYTSQGRETVLLVTVGEAVKQTRVRFGREMQEFPFPTDDPFGPFEVRTVPEQVKQVEQVEQAEQVEQVTIAKEEGENGE
jgi:hypothetical protein